MGHEPGGDESGRREAGESTPGVWCVTAHHLDDEPWWRFTVEAVGSGGRIRTHTVRTDEVTAALQVWLRRTTQRSPN